MAIVVTKISHWAKADAGTLTCAWQAELAAVPEFTHSEPHIADRATA
jgi:hypothetical protein